jgi:hypothetical protein
MGFNLLLKGVKNYEGVSWDVPVTEANNHHLDDDFEVYSFIKKFDYSASIDGDEKNVFKSLIKKNQNLIQHHLRTLMDELKESCFK